MLHYGKVGALTGPDKEHAETSMLALHLFFTATAELSGCGHGTVAAQAVRLTRTALGELNDRQHTGGRTFDTVAIRRPAGIEVWFDEQVATAANA
ncbi:hypothetical protein [Streptomyces sp. 2A115]|uniref:hypothetical protein n=1 Tax=Streptomyces sp. 2A115 TaxID=3457439 RepID=UPI003FD4CF2F